MKYDLAIIGGGPAGTAAGVYASRKALKTIFITKEWGGQSVVSSDIQNWVGTVSISGADLAKQFKKHVDAYKGDTLTVIEGESAIGIEKKDSVFTVTTDKGSTFDSRAVFIATGADRRKLNVPGAKEFDQKGLTYCASCDGPLFAGKDVAVIGGGNAGFETAAQLLAYVKSVTLLHYRDTFKADPVTIKKVLANPKMKAVTNAETLEIKGDTFVTGLAYKNTKTGKTHELPVEGVFVEIGLVPSTGFVKNLLDLDDYGRIRVDPINQTTSIPGIWAAGDSTNNLYNQNNIAAGDAVKALEDIYIYLHAK